MDQITIGARLRVIRNYRGMTLEQLAGLSGLSKSFLSMAERGQRALDRRSHIAALATALKVSETELVGGPHLSGDHVQAAPHLHIPVLRTALETGLQTDPIIERARPLPDLIKLMAGPVEKSRRHCDYVQMGSLLPDLIDELSYHIAAPADEATQVTALETLCEAYMCAAGMARALGYTDLGLIAAMRADEAAVRLDSPVHQGKAAFSLIRPSPANWGRVQSLAEQAIDRLQPHVGTGDLPVLGMLTLNAALAAASSLDHSGAQRWLDEAADIATRVPDDLERNWQAFSMTNVNVWRAAIGVEVGDGGAAITAHAALVDQGKLAAHPQRWSSWLADVGRGLARDPRTRTQAVQWLRKAEDVAPQRTRNDARVRETISVMLEQARTAAGGRELRGIASRMGVPH